MKLVTALLIAALPALAHATSFQTFHSSFNNYDLLSDFMTNGGQISDVAAATDFSAPVGSGTFRHSGAPLADGTYSFDSLSDVEIQISIEIGGTTYSFDESHLVGDTAHLQVYIANGAFHFAGPTIGYEPPEMGGSALAGAVFFHNAGHVFTTLGTEPGSLPFPVVDYYGYGVIALPVSEEDDPSSLGLGLYGTTETAYYGAAIPEPSSFAALAGLATLGLTTLRRRARA